MVLTRLSRCSRRTSAKLGQNAKEPNRCTRLGFLLQNGESDRGDNSCWVAAIASLPNFAMHLITYPDGGFTAIEPLREIHHDRAIELLMALMSAFVASEGDLDATIEQCWPIVEAICLMTPTVPGLGWDMAKLRNAPELVRELFLDADGVFLKLHEFEPKQRPTKAPKVGEKEEVELEFPSGGNDRADQIAAFMHSSQWGPSEIKALFELCSREELHSLSYTLGELADPDRREQQKRDQLAAEVAEEYGDDELDRVMNQTFVNSMFG